MGIQGLHKALKPITKRKSLQAFAGRRAGIDGHAWLHRAGYACATELALGHETKTYVYFVMRMVTLLLKHQITPVVVFDGGSLPMKKEENARREVSRKEYEEQGRQLWEAGDEEGARDKFTRCIRIKHAMVRKCIAALKTQNVEYIVAPYEGDSQLAFLYSTGQVDFCITEDSDLMTFGVRHVLCKLKDESGDSINLDDLKTWKLQSFGKKKKNNKNNITKLIKNFRNHDDFIHMCVLSGCDYLKSLYGIGLKLAARKVKEWKQLSRLMNDLKKRKGYTKEYIVNFERAVLTFKHQRVYDPRTQSLVHLNDPDERMTKFIALAKEQTGIDESTLDFLGPWMDNATAHGIAMGFINPHSKEQLGPLPRSVWRNKEVTVMQPLPPRARAYPGTAPVVTHAGVFRRSNTSKPRKIQQQQRANYQTNMARVATMFQNSSQNQPSAKELSPPPNKNANNHDIDDLLDRYKNRMSPGMYEEEQTVIFEKSCMMDETRIEQDEIETDDENANPKKSDESFTQRTVVAAVLRPGTRKRKRSSGWNFNRNGGSARKEAAAGGGYGSRCEGGSNKKSRPNSNKKRNPFAAPEKNSNEMSFVATTSFAMATPATRRLSSASSPHYSPSPIKDEAFVDFSDLKPMHKEERVELLNSEHARKKELQRLRLLEQRETDRIDEIRERRLALEKQEMACQSIRAEEHHIKSLKNQAKEKRKKEIKELNKIKHRRSNIYKKKHQKTLNDMFKKKIQ